MADSLFQRINDESVIQIVRQDQLYKPGYSWEWQTHEWQIRNGGVFESEEAALISAINHMNETYETTVINCLEAMDANEKLKEALNAKIRSSKYSWIEEIDKEFLVLMSFMGLMFVGLLSLAFLELFLASRGVPIKSNIK
jgi:hypothetical protein